MNEKFIHTTMPPFWKGISKLKAGSTKGFYIASMDTETWFGKVFATGFTHGRDEQEARNNLKIHYEAFNNFDEHWNFVLDSLLGIKDQGHKTIICGVHFLKFDLGALLFEVLNPLHTKLPKAPTNMKFSSLKQKCEVEIFMTNPCFAKIKKNGRTITLIDTYAFFHMSLDKALKMINAGFKKLPKPKALGERLIPLKEIKPYLINDVLGAWKLVEHIESLHKQYDISPCISLPMLSGKIFRRHYLKKGFPKPHAILRMVGMLSYHGGKNSLPDKNSKWYNSAYDLDVNSAYTEAMSKLPDFENGSWKWVRDLPAVKKYPHGIYRIAGTINNCKWGLLFTHDFKKAEGQVKDLWVTGYEILEALKFKELKIKNVCGYGFVENKKASKDPAFKRFALDFYKLKNEAKSPTLKMFYKLIPNSTYGKAIGRVKDEDGNFTATSMFDPAVASLITAWVRVKVHSLEHKYNAIHTATDGFITQQKPDASDIGGELGQLKLVTHGPVLVLRNKLYLHFDNNGLLSKSGLHGFQGKPDDLLKLLRSSKRVRTINHLSKWAESWHTGIPPGLSMPKPQKLVLENFNSKAVFEKFDKEKMRLK